jgi:serine-type D-Ala-D-Ala carboxypeptidase/endopeptidase (penicillin-binding protein 4)
MLTRRALLAGTGLLVAAPLWAEGPATSIRPRRRGQRDPQPEIADLIARAELGGTVAFVVAEAATGRVLEAQLPDLPLPPASVTKVVTALYALQAKGPDHRFVTRVLGSGQLRDGTLQGDLILAGGGDPTFDTDRMGDMVARLAAGGLRRIAGSFHYWTGALPDIWQIDPDQPAYVGYNPAIGGLNLNFNRINFRWARRSGDYDLTMDAEGARFVPPVSMARVTVADRDLPLFAWEGGDGRDQWTVARPALGDGGSRWLPTRHPGPYAADVFRSLAAAQGIDLPKGTSVATLPEATELARDTSEPLTDMLRDMLRFSTNLTAEIMGLTASGLPTLAESGAAMTDWARGAFGVQGRFADHSGLEPASRVSVQDLLAVLLRAKDSPHGRLLPGVLRDIGMRDAEGKEIEGHPTQVRGKSGTLNFVSNLAGFITPPSGPELAFAIICADPDRRDALPVDQRELPEGGERWTRRARRLHGQLIARWAGLYA